MYSSTTCLTCFSRAVNGLSEAIAALDGLGGVVEQPYNDDAIPMHIRLCAMCFMARWAV